MPKPLRQRQLARIHLLKKELGLDRDAYEHVVWVHGRVTSSKDLDSHGRLKVIRQMESRLPQRQRYRGRPHNADTAGREELRKIEALLTDAGQPWAYAEGIAQRMFGKNKIAFLDPRERGAVIAALHKQAVARLQGELNDHCARLGWDWVQLQQFAVQLFGFNPAHNLSRYPQAMSQLHRWIIGELRVSCAWPPAASGCAACQAHHRAR